MIRPPQQSFQPTPQNGYKWYQPPFSAQSQAGGLSPQFSVSDLGDILSKTLPVALSMLSQQSYQPSQVSAQGQGGGPFTGRFF
jgi:hypothetical protein